MCSWPKPLSPPRRDGGRAERPGAEQPGSRLPAARWKAWAGILATLAACGAPAEPEPQLTGPHHVLLVTLDTTRRDALTCYGAPAGITPELDALAADGVRFTAAYSAVPLTLPSHASMLTGLYPPRHGLRDNGLAALPSSAVTLAELAREAGYETAAFQAAVVLDRAFGLDQGFDTYVGPALAAESHSSHFAELPAEQVVERALGWLDGRDRTKRFFLWVHLFDPHLPREPAEEFQRRSPLDPYLAEVAQMDHAIGRLVARLKANEVFDDTVVMVVGDHGEAFGEHGEITHGSYCWETTLRIPMILREPSPGRAGTTVDAIVSVVDVFPTLAWAMGVPPGSEHDGQSLFGRRPDAKRGAYFESYNGWSSYGWSPLAGWLDPDGKYLHSSEPQFFDIARDPGETNDLADERAGELERYRARIAAMVERGSLGASGEAIDEALLNQIKSLGYAGLGAGDIDWPAPLAPSERPSPQSRVQEQERSLKALQLVELGRFDKAETLLREITDDNPRNFFALDRLALVLMRQGKFTAAVAPLERLVSEGPQWAGSWYNLGECLAVAERPADALAAFERALELNPRQPAFLERLHEEYAARGEAERARAMKEQLDALEVAGDGD